MNEYLDRLTETFESHEHLAPNPAEVLEKANLRARSYRRRRRAARATGASVLGAGLVAGGVALPGLKPHQQGSRTVSTASQPLSGIAAPIATPTAYTEQQEINAFIADGYDYDNAVTLSGLWHQLDLDQVKADAGQKLLAGQTLPIGSSASNPVASPTPIQPDASDSVQDQQLAAYFAAGYDYDNAVTLSGLWHETDIGQVKAEAGQKLLAGQTLPVPPTSASPTAS
jgi:hypothetical protein